MWNDSALNITDPDDEFSALCNSSSPYYVGRAGTFAFVIKTVIISSFAVPGLIGNTLCYFVLSREKKQKSHNFILKALSVADNLVLIAFVLFLSLPTAYDYSGWGLSYKMFYQLAGKSLLITFQWIAKMTSIYLTLLVTLERYVAVSRPLKAQFICTLRNARIGTVIIIIISVMYNIPKLLYYNMFQTGFDPCLMMIAPIGDMTDLYKTKMFQTVYGTGLYFVVIYIIPLSILFVLNYYLIVMVRRSYRKRAKMISTPTQTNDKFTERIIGVVSSFIILESPAIIMNLYFVQKPELTSADFDTLNMVYVLSVINSVINFYIYVCVGKSFRDKLGEVLRCSGRRKSRQHKAVETPAVACINGNNPDTPVAEQCTRL